MTKQNWMRAHHEDLIRRTKRRWEDELSDFMPLSEAQEILSLARGEGVFGFLFGGYEEAERVRIYFSMFDANPTPEAFQIHVVSYRGRTEFATINHRDYLGALMSLGFERTKIGDLSVQEKGFDVLVTNPLVDYLLHTPLSVRGIPLQAKAISLEKWQPPIRDYENKYLQVPSLRLDALIARAFKLSRGKALELIRAGNVQLNHRVAVSPSQCCKIGDRISALGKGKFLILTEGRPTRKGNLQIEIAFYR